MASNETVAEITGRMRRIKLCIPRGKVKVDDFDCVVEVSLSDFADRIEAAHKREIAAKDAEIAERVRSALSSRSRSRRPAQYGRAAGEAAPRGESPDEVRHAEGGVSCAQFDEEYKANEKAKL